MYQLIHTVESDDNEVSYRQVIASFGSRPTADQLLPKALQVLHWCSTVELEPLLQCTGSVLMDVNDNCLELLRVDS